MQTPAGTETPSGMHSVMSSVRGGVETPDFLELRKGREVSETPLPNRSLYQVLPERQTAVRGLMGSERGYDVSSVGGAVPVLGEERGTKVRSFSYQKYGRRFLCFVLSLPLSERMVSM